MKQDQMSMAASIESRVPFLDHELVEYGVHDAGSASSSAAWTTKAVLREALKDRVPAEILERRKMGFPVPFGRWARERFAACRRARPSLARGPSPAGCSTRAVLERLVAEHEAGPATTPTGCGAC